VSAAYPLLLDLSDRLVVIIGGGAVAARKAAGVLAGGAQQVRVIAPALAAAMPAGVEHVATRYDPKHLSGAGLIFAATDQPDVNAAIVRDARAAGIPVNRADHDDEDAGDFTVPAMLRRGELTIAISAGGAAALAVKVRDVIAGTLDDAWPQLAEVTKSLRPRIISSISDPTRRRAAMHDLASDEAAALASSGPDKLVTWLAERFPELKPTQAT